MVLKPQDVVVVLKLCNAGRERPPFAELAHELFMSPSEVHAAVKRAQAARLLHGPELGGTPNRKALEEFLLHGVKYAFPAQHGTLTRGMPTSYAAEPLRRHIQSGQEPPPVWPSADGPVRGIAMEPLYPSVPKAAQRDPRLYEMLTLVDALRDGRTRERKIAEKELLARLREKKHGKTKS
jgi:hypothetical protein